MKCWPFLKPKRRGLKAGTQVLLTLMELIEHFAHLTILLISVNNNNLLLMENKTPSEELANKPNVSLSSYSERAIEKFKKSNLRHDLQSTAKDLWEEK